MEIAISKIDLIQISYDQSIEFKDDQLNIGYGLTVNYFKDENVLQYYIKVDFLNKEDNSEIVTSISETSFKIKDFEEGKDDELCVMFALGFQHHRGLLYALLAATKFNRLVLPIIKPKDVFDSIFKGIIYK